MIGQAPQAADQKPTALEHHDAALPSLSRRPDEGHAGRDLSAPTRPDSEVTCSPCNSSRGIHDDPDHSIGESREIIIGYSTGGALLLVSFTERGEAVRIISARHVDRHERRDYEEDG